MGLQKTADLSSLKEGMERQEAGKRVLAKGLLGGENDTHLADEKIEAQVGKPGS